MSRTHSETELFETLSCAAISEYAMPCSRISRAFARIPSFALGRKVQAGGGSPRKTSLSVQLLVIRRISLISRRDLLARLNAMACCRNSANGVVILEY